MGKANSVVKVKFRIPNNACKHYAGLSECSRDEKPHTCCEEECGLMEVQLGFQEASVKTHHDFVDGVCKHCGDTEVHAKERLDAYNKSIEAQKRSE